VTVFGVTDAGRATAKSRMLDTWAIGTAATSYVAGVDATVITVLFTTKARLTTRSTIAREAQVGERTSVETRRELHIPWDSPVVPVNAVAQCTAIDASTDPTLLGATVRVTGSSPASQKTARRLEVSEVLS